MYSGGVPYHQFPRRNSDATSTIRGRTFLRSVVAILSKSFARQLNESSHRDGGRSIGPAIGSIGWWCSMRNHWPFSWMDRTLQL